LENTKEEGHLGEREAEAILKRILEDIGCGAVVWIRLGQNRIKGRVLVQTVMKFRVR
jgi:hypothetical protein